MILLRILPENDGIDAAEDLIVMFLMRIHIKEHGSMDDDRCFGLGFMAKE